MHTYRWHIISKSKHIVRIKFSCILLSATSIMVWFLPLLREIEAELDRCQELWRLRANAEFRQVLLRRTKLRPLNWGWDRYHWMREGPEDSGHSRSSKNHPDQMQKQRYRCSAQMWRRCPNLPHRTNPIKMADVHFPHRKRESHPPSTSQSYFRMHAGARLNSRPITLIFIRPTTIKTPPRSLLTHAWHAQARTKVTKDTSFSYWPNKFAIS